MHPLMLFKMLMFITAVFETVFDMINAVYHGKSLIITKATFREKLVSHHQAFITAVSETVFDMINVVYRGKSSIITEATFREKLVFHTAVSETVFDMINGVYRGKSLIITEATFREKLASHHRAVNEADSCLHTRHASSKVMARTKSIAYVDTVLF